MGGNAIFSIKSTASVKTVVFQQLWDVLPLNFCIDVHGPQKVKPNDVLLQHHPQVKVFPCPLKYLDIN